MKKKFLQASYFLFALLLLINTKKTIAQAPEFALGSVNNVATTTVVIPVTSKNFKQILAWQGSVNWDNSKLTYSGISTPIAQLTGMVFNASVASSSGRLAFIWFDDNLTGQTITDNTILFNITFNVVPGATASTDIIFSGTPTALVLSDVNAVPINDVVYTKGTVSFLAAYIPPEFIIGSVANVSASTVVIPVTCKNFSQLLAIQGSINWDNNKLTYAGIGTPAVQLTGIQFNASVNVTTGRLGFVWLENNLTPQTIADNTVLFSITFNVVSAGANGSTDIVFSNTPTQLLISDAAATPLNDVVFTKGTVSFTGAVLPPEFSIGSAFNVSTATVVIPVTTKNFVQLLAMQGSINWDNTKLSYASTSTPFAQLSGMLFNPAVAGNTGQLSYLWSDINLLPQTIADNTVLFTITFNVLPGASGVTDIIFSNTPSSLLLSNASFAAVTNSVYNNGNVSFSASICGSGASTTFTSNLTGISYQWQTDAGTGIFSNITDNSNYSGVTLKTVNLTNLPTAWAGYKYRCIVNGVASNVFKLSFSNTWFGTQSTAWETAANWSCGTIPDVYTDVIINAGSPNNPIINANTSCRSITANAASLLTIKAGINLILLGK